MTPLRTINPPVPFATFTAAEHAWLASPDADGLQLSLELDVEYDERGERVLASGLNDPQSVIPWVVLAQPAGASLEMVVQLRPVGFQVETEVIPAGSFEGLEAALRFVSAAHHGTVV